MDKRHVVLKGAPPDGVTLVASVRRGRRREIRVTAQQDSETAADGPCDPWESGRGQLKPAELSDGRIAWPPRPWWKNYARSMADTVPRRRGSGTRRRKTRAKRHQRRYVTLPIGDHVEGSVRRLPRKLYCAEDEHSSVRREVHRPRQADKSVMWKYDAFGSESDRSYRTWPLLPVQHVTECMSRTAAWRRVRHVPVEAHVRQISCRTTARYYVIAGPTTARSWTVSTA